MASAAGKEAAAPPQLKRRSSKTQAAVTAEYVDLTIIQQAQGCPAAAVSALATLGERINRTGTSIIYMVTKCLPKTIKTKPKDWASAVALEKNVRCIFSAYAHDSLACLSHVYLKYICAPLAAAVRKSCYSISTAEIALLLPLTPIFPVRSWWISSTRRRAKASRGRT